ncbi:MAG: ABC transporter ATP-binding protein [Actinomycetota bacterium]
MMKRQRAGLALGMLIGLGWAAGRVAIPFLVQQAIDRAIDVDRVDTGALVRWAAAILAAGALSGVMLGLRRYLGFHNARLIEARLRDRIFAHLQRLHFAFHDANATGDLMSRANTDLQQFQNFITIVPMLTGSIITVVAVTVIMVAIQPLLAVLALAGLPLVYVLGRAFSTRLFPQVAEVQRRLADLAGVVEETVVGIRVVKGFGAEGVQAEKLSTAAERVYGPSMGALLTRSRFLPAMEAVPNVGLIIVLAYGGNLVLQGSMTIGELVSFSIYVILTIQPLRTIGTAVTNGQRAAAAGVRIQELLGTAPEIVAPDRPQSLPTEGPRGRVEFRDVDFAYPTDGPGPAVAVLERFSLTVAPGESVALVGATGSGKSTVANLIPRFYDVDRGAVFLDGVDVRDLRPQDLRREVGLVFEETFLFSASIAENIAFADPDATPAIVQRAAAAAGVDFVADLPSGWDTPVGERGHALSGGQRQRLAIARAVLADPRVLILDDATSAVDPGAEHRIADALSEVMAGRTTIVIAHRAATVAVADRVVFVDRGRVVATGTHDELLITEPRYRAVLAAAEDDGIDVAGTVGR